MEDYLSSPLVGAYGLTYSDLSRMVATGRLQRITRGGFYAGADPVRLPYVPARSAVPRRPT
ncbi:hypothetical protein [Sphaerimonospora mesophila]|uniref:hypothetical protein n=1 Tax=Sphaerimonospora mesophila TaxID=37483 RepID=UPI0006E3D927